MTTLTIEYTSTDLTLCACGSAAEPESDYCDECAPCRVCSEPGCVAKRCRYDDSDRDDR